MPATRYIHLVGLGYINIPGTLPLTAELVTYAVIRFVMAAALTILASVGIYRVFEIPCRTAVRRAFKDIDGVPAALMIVALTGIPTLVAAYGWAVSFGIIK